MANAKEGFAVASVQNKSIISAEFAGTLVKSIQLAWSAAADADRSARGREG